MNFHQPLTLIIQNRADPNADGKFTIPADGWFQIARKGAYKTRVTDDLTVEQLIDDETYARILANFSRQAAAPNFRGILVDFDHASWLKDGSTAAAAWLDQVAIRDGELYGKLRLSNSGRAAIENGDYRGFSLTLGIDPAEVQPGKPVRPAAILRGALTNDERMTGMVPLSNREDPSQPETEKPTATNPMLDKLKKLLGLADDANEDAVIAAVTKLQEAGAAADETAKERDALKEDVVEGDLEKFKDVIHNRDSTKTALMADREGTLVILKARAEGIKPDGYKPVHNRKDARQPESPLGKGSSKKELTGDQQRDAAVAQYRAHNRCDFQTAWNAVQLEKPELFADEVKDTDSE